MIPAKAEPDFIELMGGVMTPGCVECMIEWADGRGATVQMRIRGAEPHIVQLTILLIDPIGSSLLLLALKGLNRWMLIHIYFRLISGYGSTSLEDPQE